MSTPLPLPGMSVAAAFGHPEDACKHRAEDTCRTCTGCYHGRHADCRGETKCPDDSIIRTCACCGCKS